MGYGRGKKGSFSPKFLWASRKSFFTVRTNGDLVVNLKWHGQPDAGERAASNRDEFLRRLQAAGFNTPEGTDYPSLEATAWAAEADALVTIVQDLFGHRP
jgi:hypothetical protein